MSRLVLRSSFARSALVWLAMVPAAAIAAPVVPHIGSSALDNSFAKPIFDDGGWRVRSHACCSDIWKGRSVLGRNPAPRLGGRDQYYDRPTYGNRYDHFESSDRYRDEPVYEHQRLTRPRVYQQDSLGGGYFGDPD